MGGKAIHYCQQCGYQALRWMGRCPGCGAWNTMVEEIPVKGRNQIDNKEKTMPLPITELELNKEDRYSTGIAEFDRVLGGGVVPGSLILVGGDPGIGKSTLLLEVAYAFADQGQKVLYASGEESASQLRLRAERIGILSPNLFVVCETNLDIIERFIDQLGSDLIVIDSIQTVFKEELSSAPGSVSQVRECGGHLMRLAKQRGISIFLIGHVTKEGTLAGPKVLEHLVDTVLYFEGDRHQTFRILRGVKNRFGSINEIGIFEMQGRGLIEVPNPSAIFLLQRPQEKATGSVVVPVLEGTRPLLVEIQGLVCPGSGFGVPRRMTAGVDYNRVTLIMAVLEKRASLRLAGCDAYVNAVGGAQLEEPACDLGIALAIASSFYDQPIDTLLTVIGEIGLTGEVRPVSGIEKRVREAARLGFTCCLVPNSNLSQVDCLNMEVRGIGMVTEAIEIALGEQLRIKD